MPPRVPTEADFAPLSSSITLTLTWPEPAELTTSFLIVFHGLGDSEVPFVNFAKGMALPHVLCISVRGTSPLPSALLGGAPGSGVGHFHWGDDLKIDPATEELDQDPGFERAKGLVLDSLMRDILVQKCGWGTEDIMLFGFGQGGSLALGLAAGLRAGPRVEDVSEEAGQVEESRGRNFKGVVSLGGPLPSSMVSTLSNRAKSSTPLLVCQLDEDEVEAVQREFEKVEVERWQRKEVAMPRERDEMFPIMKFFAEQLKNAW